MKTLNWLKENPEIQEYLLEQIKNRALNSEDTTLVTDEENVDAEEEFVEELENSEIEMENPADTIE